ncbi:MAG: ShlB/FhaC/HecB family hemolysin secretion/activation protein, partial [Alphaproteobacteria bacterium]|nr:ShlB/FhaC/HecB family hemolysin secretion/activation protein [Alphaproteobacteria bacterium]
MSTKTTILVVCCLLILSHTSKAEEAQDIINQQDWITRQQQNILEEKKRTAEFETIKKEHERLKKEEAQGAQQVVTGEMRTCVALQEIKLIDAKSLSSSLKKKITKPFLGRCLDAKLFTEIIKMVSDHYHANGYATVQVLAPKQNLQSGILELQIIEGKIETLSLGGDGLRERMQKFTAFGNIENKTLNVNDINQGIAQMNRLPSRQSAMK